MDRFTLFTGSADRRTQRPAWLTVSCCLVALTVPVVIGRQHAVAAMPSSVSDSHLRLVAVQGSSQYLAFESTNSSTTVHAGFVNAGELYVMGRHGHLRRLAKVRRRDESVSLVGSSLLLWSSLDPVTFERRVNWWDLAAHTAGSATLPSNDVPVSAAPSGWVSAVETSNGKDGTCQAASKPCRTDLQLHRFGGSTVDLGSPMPAGTTPQFIAGPFGLVGFAFGGNSSEEGKIVAMPWKGDRRWRTLLKPGADRGNICNMLTARSVSCQLTGKANVSLALLSLSGGPTVRFSPKQLAQLKRGGCVSLSAIPHHGSAVSIATASQSCTPGTLSFLSLRSHLIAISSHRFAAVLPVNAFDRVAVSSSQQRHLDLVGGATSKPKMVVSTRDGHVLAGPARPTTSIGTRAG